MEEIVFDNEAKEGLKRGIEKLSRAVKTTLGPSGRNAVIFRDGLTPLMTKDGVTVARSIMFKDKLENIGAEMIKEVSSNTDSSAGDGTTTATVLAEAILTEGLKSVANGANPIELKRGIDAGVKYLVARLKASSTPITKNSQIEEVATISSNNDQVIGKLMAHAFGKVGKHGVVTVEDSPNHETTVDVVQGMQFDRGVCSEYFLKDTNTGTVTMEKPFILVYDGKISSISDEMIRLLEGVKASGKGLVIIAHDVDGQALSSLVSNKMAGTLKVTAVKAPGFGLERSSLLKDIACSIGATPCNYPADIKPDNLGRSDSFLSSRVSTTIVGGHAPESARQERVVSLTETRDGFDADSVEYKRMDTRIAKLSGGVGVIYVGAISELEAKEKKDRVIDALHAVQSALEEGVVVGGGVALVQSTFLSTATDVDLGEDHNLGIKIVTRAACQPLKQIAENAGASGDVMLDAVINSTKLNVGFNAKSGKVEDLLAAGIVDPLKVTRCALENAASVSGMILTTSCVVLN